MKNSLIYLVKWVRGETVTIVSFFDSRDEANEMCKFMQNKLDQKDDQDWTRATGSYVVEVVGRGPTPAQLAAAQYAKHGRR